MGGKLQDVVVAVQCGEKDRLEISHTHNIFVVTFNRFCVQLVPRSTDTTLLGSQCEELM